MTMRHDDGEDYQIVKFYNIMQFHGGDTDKTTEEEWSCEIAKGLQNYIDDPNVKFHYIEPHLIYIALTEHGATNLLNYLNLGTYFPGAKVEAYPVKDDPDENDYGYMITFPYRLGTEKMTDREQMIELEGMERVDEFFNTANCATFSIVEDSLTGEQEGTLLWEVSYTFLKDREADKMGFLTDVPVFLETLKEYYEDESLENNILRILVNYLTYTLTEDLLSKIDGYEEDPFL